MRVYGASICLCFWFCRSAYFSMLFYASERVAASQIQMQTALMALVREWWTISRTRSLCFISPAVSLCLSCCCCCCSRVPCSSTCKSRSMSCLRLHSVHWQVGSGYYVICLSLIAPNLQVVEFYPDMSLSILVLVSHSPLLHALPARHLAAHVLRDIPISIYVHTHTSISDT